MAYCKFDGPGDKHARIFNEPFLALMDLHLVHTFRAHSVCESFKRDFQGIMICM
jgi:hypothetical protein